MRHAALRSGPWEAGRELVARGHVEGHDGELARRLAAYDPPPPAFTRGVLGRYCALVGSAADGATLR